MTFRSCLGGAFCLVAEDINDIIDMTVTIECNKYHMHIKQLQYNEDLLNYFILFVYFFRQVTFLVKLLLIPHT